MKSPRTRAFTCVPLLLLITLTCSCLGVNSKDIQIIQSFRKNTNQFQQLLQMTEEDHINSINNTSVLIKPQVTQQRVIAAKRLRQYRQLFSELSLEGVQDDTLGHIYFVVNASSMWNATTEKGLVYSLNALTPQVGSLDNFHLSNSTPQAFRSISNHWYVFLSID